MTAASRPACDGALLAPDEPPAAELFHADGRAPVLLLCDHASARVPRALGDLGVPPEAFHRHIAWDIGAAEVARSLARRFDAPLALSGYSRLAIDLNRRLGDPTSIPPESDGTPVPGNRGLTAAQRTVRAEALFRPYHRRIAEWIAARRAQGAVPALVSIHSCTPVWRGAARPWQVGVLWNRDGRIAVPLMAGLAAAGDIVVGDNQPYSARDGHGFTLDHHAEAAGLPHVLLEIRQDLIDTRRGAAAWAGRVARALGPILADPALRRIERF